MTSQMMGETGELGGQLDGPYGKRFKIYLCPKHTFPSYFGGKNPLSHSDFQSLPLTSFFLRPGVQAVPRHPNFLGTLPPPPGGGRDSTEGRHKLRFSLGFVSKWSKKFRQPGTWALWEPLLRVGGPGGPTPPQGSQI